MTTKEEQFQFSSQTQWQQTGKEYLMHWLPQHIYSDYINPSNKIYTRHFSSPFSFYSSLAFNPFIFFQLNNKLRPNIYLNFLAGNDCSDNRRRFHNRKICMLSFCIRGCNCGVYVCRKHRGLKQEWCPEDDTEGKDKWCKRPIAIATDVSNEDNLQESCWSSYEQIWADRYSGEHHSRATL